MLKVLTEPRSPLADNSESVFQSLDFFILRSPVLPVDVYKEVFAPCSDREEMVQRLARLAEQPVIREAIAVASPSLLQALAFLERDDQPRKQEQALRGFVRYLIRMTTRATPFGLFSGVTYGHLKERAELQLQGVKSHRKRTRPDMMWLLRVVRDLEANPEVVEQLRVAANPLLYRMGERVLLPYVTQYGQGKRNQVEHSVGASEVVELALAEAAEPVAFTELLDRLQARYGDTPREKISQFLWQLFQQEFLISDLRPSMANTAPFEDMLRRLEDVQGIEDIKARLREIAAQLAEYDARPLGEGEDLYFALLQNMRGLADQPHLLQVDMGLARGHVELPSAIGEEAARAVEVLWRLSRQGTGRSHLASYREEFLNRYGWDREVPLLELLDEAYGLGAPATYENPASSRSADEKRNYPAARQSLLFQLVAQAIRSGQYEIELTEEMICLLEPCEVNREELPLTSEISFSLAAPSLQAVEEGEYRLILGGSPGSSGAGKTFGRHIDVLGSEVSAALRETQEREHALCPDAVFAELVLLPTEGRAGNVMLTDAHRPYIIPIGAGIPDDSKRVIPVSDLVVGMVGEEMYLRSKTLNKVVIPTANHLFNVMIAPNVYRFLRDIAWEGRRSWQLFEWELEASPFLPRLRYGRVVLSPATWNLNRMTEPFDTMEFEQALQMWRETWQVPRHVYLTDGDNRLLLDLDLPFHVDEVRRVFQNLQEDAVMLFTETAQDLDEAAVVGEGGFFLNELVFPLIRREASSAPKEIVPRPHLSARERTHLPGSEWLFCKLYGPRAWQEELIGQHVSAFCDELEKASLCDVSFFMRYADPEPHVRLRVHGDPRVLTNSVLPSLYGWAAPLQEAGMLTRVTIDTYEQETERYGGPALIGMAERLFAEDSCVVAGWWNAKQAGAVEMETRLFAVISVLDVLVKFGLSFPEQVRWFETRIDAKQDREEFRRQRQVLLTTADPANEWAGLRGRDDGEQVLQLLGLRGRSTREYAEAVHRARQEGNLWSDFDSVLASVLHMHLNRLLGTDRREESVVMALVRHTLQALHLMRENRS